MPVRVKPLPPERLLADLTEATDLFDRLRVEEICQQIIASPGFHPPKFLKQAMNLMRRKLFFDQMQKLADGLIRNGEESPELASRYAQALIDNGLQVPALSVLRDALAGLQDNAAEEMELTGLVGRAWKQSFVESGGFPAKLRAQQLNKAIQAYLAMYNKYRERALWHGINVVAVLSRARQERIPVTGIATSKAKELAREILGIVTANAEPQYWDLATAAEACLALGDHKAMMNYARLYVGAAGVDAFELQSMVRQMEQVWLLKDEKEPGKSLLSLLRGHLMRKKAAVTEVPAGEIQSARKDPKALRGVFGKDLETYESYKKGLEVAQAIAMISGPEGTGTGFLVNARDMKATAPDEIVLMTCGHVLGPKDITKAEVRFEVAAFKCRVVKAICYLDRACGDLGLWRLSKLPKGVKPCVVRAGPLQIGERTYVVGHPEGLKLTYAVSSNELLGIDNRKIYYQTPSRPGSSGSPIFDDSWNLIGFHQAGGATISLSSRPVDTNVGVSVRQAKEIIMEMGSDQNDPKK